MGSGGERLNWKRSISLSPCTPSRKIMNQGIFSPHSCLYPTMRQTAADKGPVIKRLLAQILLTLGCKLPSEPGVPSFWSSSITF